jgi:hypothetical protein
LYYNRLICSKLSYLLFVTEIGSSRSITLFTIFLGVLPNSCLFQVTRVFKEIGFYQFSVQVEKEQYYTHRAGLSSQLKADFGFAGKGRDSLVMIKAV